RPGVLVGRQRILLDGSGFGIEASQLVYHLLGEPERAVGADCGIMWMRALSGNRPLLNGDIERADVRGSGQGTMRGQRQRDERRTKHNDSQRESSFAHGVPPLFGRLPGPSGYMLRAHWREGNALPNPWPDDIIFL